MAGTVLVTKIALKNVGNPKQITVLPETVRELHLGAIVGVATNVKRGKMPDGVTETIGLAGSFEAIPADASKDTVRSGVCYLPDAFMLPIIDALSDEIGSDGKVTKEGVASVQFAFEVYAIRAENPQGYSWQLRAAVPPTENDPLAEAKKALVALRATPAPQIEQAAKK